MATSACMVLAPCFRHPSRWGSPTRHDASRRTCSLVCPTSGPMSAWTAEIRCQLLSLTTLMSDGASCSTSEESRRTPRNQRTVAAQLCFIVVLPLQKKKTLDLELDGMQHGSRISLRYPSQFYSRPQPTKLAPLMANGQSPAIKSLQISAASESSALGPDLATTAPQSNRIVEWRFPRVVGSRKSASGGAASPDPTAQHSPNQSFHLFCFWRVDQGKVRSRPMALDYSSTMVSTAMKHIQKR